MSHWNSAATRTRVIFAGGVILAASVLVAALRDRASAHTGHDGAEIGEFDLDAPRSVTPETAKHIGLKVEEISVQPLEEVLEITGVVRPHPDRHRMIVARTAGKLRALSVHVGSVVKRGDVLAEIESPELARNLYEARKLVVDQEKLLLEASRRLGDVQRLERGNEALQQQLELARRDHDRAAAVVGQGVPVREVESRKSEVARLEGELKSRGVEIEVARRDVAGLNRQADALRLSREAVLAVNNLEADGAADQPVQSQLKVLAESDGVVVERLALPGSWVQAGHNLLRIADYSLVQVEGELPESLIRRVEQRSSNRVRVRPASDPGVTLDGALQFVAPELEPVKRTAHVLIDVPNPNGVLRAEMWTQVAIVLREARKALVVPKSAVVSQGPMHFVFLEIESADAKTGEPAKFQKKDINPGIRSDQFIEVRDGIFPNDRVVTQGAYSLTQLRPKAKAAVKDASQPKSPQPGGHKH